MIYKLVTDAAAAVADITDGSTIMLGGFGLCGIPENCIQAILEKGTTNLTSAPRRWQEDPPPPYTGQKSFSR
jgi:acyl CoA:acetate/3-ketoacid CoA transferase alpha subunit